MKAKKNELNQGELALLEILDDADWYGEFCKELEKDRAEQEDEILQAAYLASLLKPRQVKIKDGAKVIKPAKSVLEIVKANSKGREILPLTNDSAIKNVGGVYLILRDNELLYVGQSCNLDSRLREHHWGFGAEVLYIVCKDLIERLELEAQLIKATKPILNVRHNSN